VDKLALEFVGSEQAAKQQAVSSKQPAASSQQTVDIRQQTGEKQHFEHDTAT
jgi:hypothetical protein